MHLDLCNRHKKQKFSEQKNYWQDKGLWDSARLNQQKDFHQGISESVLLAQWVAKDQNVLKISSIDSDRVFVQAAWGHCRQQSQNVGFLTQRLKLLKSGNTKKFWIHFLLCSDLDRSGLRRGCNS